MPVHFSRRTFLKSLSAGAIACASTQACSANWRINGNTHSPEKPNILFILMDDLGKEWISTYGAEDVETPNIDAIAKQGMTFSNAYSMASCTPSRVSLLTGQYPWRTGWVNHWDVPRGGVGYFDWKQRQNLTFARLMQDLGYVTCASGKWQVNDFRVDPDAMEKHGFDEWCMWTGSEAGNPVSENRYWDPYINTKDGSKTYRDQFGPDVHTDFMIDFMQRHRDEPMCLYFPMTLTHPPQTNTPDELEVTGMLDQHKAMVRYADKLVGQLVQALDDLDIRDRTVIIFSTDNGTHKRITGTLNGRKVSGGKASESEAGVCAPFIVSCPGLVASGVETDALTDFTDLLPTFVELGGGQVPDDLVIDGVSIAPILLGDAQDSSREWIMALGHGSASVDEEGIHGRDAFTARVIRDKQYKVLISNQKTITQLYDLKADPTEQKNLLDSKASEHRVAQAKFQAVLDSIPDQDARPLYEPREPNPWDVQPGQEGKQGNDE